MGLSDGIRSIDEIDLELRRVLIRTDFDVRIEGDAVVDDTPIRRALPTIQLAVTKGARVVIAAHLDGAAEGGSSYRSLEPVGMRLSELTGWEIHFPEECVGDGPKKLLADLRPGQVVLLENLRADAGEEADDEQFARKLAELCDVYVNDAFRMCDEPRASVHMLPRVVRERAAGLLLLKELEIAETLTSNPTRPYAAVLGALPVPERTERDSGRARRDEARRGGAGRDGAGRDDVRRGASGRGDAKRGTPGRDDISREEEAFDLLDVLLPRLNTIVLGGSLANTFLAAQGHALHPASFAPDKLAFARTMLEKAREAKVEVVLPVDMMVQPSSRSEDLDCRAVAALARDQMPCDIGPKTVDLFTRALGVNRALGAAKTVFWSGPLGSVAKHAFGSGTEQVVRAMAAQSQALTVAAGADTTQALATFSDPQIAKGIQHVSTGGRAALLLLQGKRLPGLEALRG